MIDATLILIVAAFLVSCPLTAVMKRLGARLGHLDTPGAHKTHDRPIPATGGVAVFWAIAAPMTIGLIAAWAAPASLWERTIPAAVEHLPGVKERTGMLAALLVSLAALHITGVIDDRRNLGPMIKFGVQIAAAAVLVIFFNVRLLELLGAPLSIAITIFWFVAITNAFNFLDNMDGLSGGVATIAASIFCAAALLNEQWFIAAMLALLVGALLGFLVYNFPPATIFMGDGGSLVVGFAMAFCAARMTYYNPDAGTGWWAVATPIVVLAIPIYDLCSVTLIRLSQGRSPFVGDTQHFSHRLVRRGLSRRSAVIVIWACTLATGLGGVMLGHLKGWQAALVVAQTLAVVLVLALLELTAIRRDAS